MRSVFCTALCALFLLPSLGFGQSDVLKSDEPAFSNFLLPLPEPTFAACPGGFFTASAEDGPDLGISPGTFGLEVRVSGAGNLQFEGGLNFGALVDASQVVFAGFNLRNPANENQRLNFRVLGRSSRGASLPVVIRVIKDPEGENRLIQEFSTTLSMAQAFTQSVSITPGFHVVTVAATGAGAVSGGAADGEVFVELGTQFLDRPGGGFFGGVVVGGYHALNPFGGPSGYSGFCLGSQHTASARLLSTPTYASGARDLRLRFYDVYRREITPTAPLVAVQTTLRLTNTLSTPLYDPNLNGNEWPTIAPNTTVDLIYSGVSGGRLQFGVATDAFSPATRLELSNPIEFDATGQILAVSVRHDNLSAYVSVAGITERTPVALYAPTILQNNTSPVQARMFDGLRNTESAVILPSFAGAVAITNRNLPNNPRVFFAILPEQTARIRAVQNGTGFVVTIYEQSYLQLLAAPSGEVVATIGPDAFNGGF